MLSWKLKISIILKQDKIKSSQNTKCPLNKLGWVFSCDWLKISEHVETETWLIDVIDFHCVLADSDVFPS